MPTATPKHEMEESAMARVMADCRRFPSEKNCSLTILGDEEEVLRAGTQHAVDAHGHADTPELRAKLRELLEPESGYVSGGRKQEALPT